MTQQEWVEVYRAKNAVEAHIVAGALENAGIEVQIDGEALVGGVGILPPGWSTSPRVLVADSGSTDFLSCGSIRRPRSFAGNRRTDSDRSGPNPVCCSC